VIETELGEKDIEPLGPTSTLTVAPIAVAANKIAMPREKSVLLTVRRFIRISSFGPRRSVVERYPEIVLKRKILGASAKK
jgi:hypothetical protein